MGKGDRQAGVLGAGEPAVRPRGPEGLDTGSKAAQALPPPVPEVKGTVAKRPYAWRDGKAQILFCRLGTPAPDYSWSLKKIRQDTKRASQLGFTDCAFESETVSIPKAEEAGYFSGRAALRTIAIHLPKELNVTNDQISAAEKAKNDALVKQLKAFQACRDLILAHELKHVDEAWATLSDQTLGWNLKLSGSGEVTQKLMIEAIDEGASNGPTQIKNSADTFDGNDLGPLRSACRDKHVFIDDGENSKFLYVEPANP